MQDTCVFSEATLTNLFIATSYDRHMLRGLAAGIPPRQTGVHGRSPVLKNSLTKVFCCFLSLKSKVKQYLSFEHTQIKVHI